MADIDPIRKEIQPSSFKGVKFNSVVNSNSAGSRLVIHERPKQNVPFIEDMGNRYKIISMSGFVAGDNWEKQRNDLINAFTTGPGQLVHPELGKIEVFCQDWTATEDKVVALGRTDFELVFIETQKSSPTAFIDSAEKVRSAGKASISKLQKIFDTVYTITNLPNFVYDFVSEKVTELTGSSPYEILSVVSAYNTLRNTDFSLPPILSANIANFTAAFNFDFTDDEGTNTITPKIAMDQCVILASRPIDYIAPTTPTTIKQNEAAGYVEQFLKQTAIIEASISSTYIEYSNYDEAQTIWNNIIEIFDELIEQAGNSNNTEPYRILRDCKSNFMADIKVRAPTLTRVEHKSINKLTPALVIAWDQYEDLDREEEIITRNKIKHPGFIITDDLELLVE